MDQMMSKGPRKPWLNVAATHTPPPVEPPALCISPGGFLGVDRGGVGGARDTTVGRAGKRPSQEGRLLIEKAPLG